MNTRHWIGAIAAAAVYAAALVSAHPQESPEGTPAPFCYGLATLKVSFRVVFPGARQETLDPTDTRAYLEAYNTYGDPTNFQADTMFLNIIPNGPVMGVLMMNGQSCGTRLIVGPKLHELIMIKVKAGAI